MSLQVPRFDKACIAVIGDVMLDHYWYGDTSRISPEAPVPVVRIQDTETRAGGAANVACNVAALGATASLMGAVGDDDAGRALERVLEHAGVRCELQRFDGFETIIKTRIISRHQQLLRLDRERPLARDASRDLASLVTPLLEAADVVVVSDYDKGALADVELIIAEARRVGRPILVDPKGQGFERYAGAFALTPNQAEFEAVVGRCRDSAELAERGGALVETLGLEAMLVTRGEHGMSLIVRGQPALELPTEAREVFDVTGAGDTVIASLACALAAGADLPEAARIANLAAGLVVSKLGASSVSRDELVGADDAAALEDALPPERDSVLAAVREAQARGERVVMTNGCFDILHAGHVSYLEQARRLGDRLLVAINDDASVARLKGPERPLNRLASRARVLQAMAAVDWVVSFSEDTPASLIAEVAPDVLVKGGDYRPEDIAGADSVLARGARVEVLDYIEGHSTTSLLDRVRGRAQ